MLCQSYFPLFDDYYKFGGECKLRPSSMCSFLKLLSYVQIIFPSNLFSNTLGVRFSLNVGDEVVYSGNIVLLLPFVVALFCSPSPIVVVISSYFYRLCW